LDADSGVTLGQEVEDLFEDLTNPSRRQPHHSPSSSTAQVRVPDLDPKAVAMGPRSCGEVVRISPTRLRLDTFRDAALAIPAAGKTYWYSLSNLPK
jgi:hypothetical protein